MNDYFLGVDKTMRKSILKKDKSYTFSDYFKLPYPTRDVVAEFGYQFQVQKLDLPENPGKALNVEKLKETFYKKLPHVTLNSEAAKREFFISPLLFELLDYVEMEIDVEYPVNINERLKGNIDYLIHTSKEIIVIEAKNADMDKGFTQLAVELIAMDHYLENEAGDILYGVITIGDVWRFGVLERLTKKIIKNIDAFLVPAQLEKLLGVLLCILEEPRT
ncbi:MAG: hypothetical protein ABFS56_31385 [Pseudomonadota bacterium]